MILIYLLFPYFSFAAELPPSPFPIFLKQGYSSVLEFEENPSQVVIGDSQAFQVERLKKSIVVRAKVAEASTNMFVYFNNKSPQLLILTASDDAEPTYYKKFESILTKKVATQPKPKATRYARSTRLLTSEFDSKKDYLTLEIRMSADSTESISPKWKDVRLAYGKKSFTPHKSWAERQVIQKDSTIKARFVFRKPDVPRDLKNVALLIPIVGYKNPVRLSMPVRLR